MSALDHFRLLRADARTEIHDLTLDSRAAGEGSLFLALHGAREDGADYAKEAAARGAGCGVKIVPVAFLVLQGERVRMLPITEPATSTADRLIEQIPELVDRINEMISQYRAEKKVDVDLA